MTKHRARGIAAFTLATLHLGCGANGLTDPAPAGSQSSSTQTSGALRTQNAAPSLIVVTSPAADGGTISGTPPLTVTFNLCRSADPDADSLNWQFNFGDSGKAAFNDDGTFNRDADQTCRVEHTYREGTYTAWVSVTDKHLEDQSRGVSSLARRSQSFTIRAERASEPPVVTLPGPSYCHTGIAGNPGPCAGPNQFCEAVPISSTSSAHARDACNACVGSVYGACVPVTAYGASGWASANWMFVYSSGTSVVNCTGNPGGFVPQPADIFDLGNGCGQGLW